MTEENKTYKHRKEFKIYQKVKLSGLRTNKKEVFKTRFVSPIFGKRLVDKIVVPKSEQDLSDKDKLYDTFRVKPKLTKEVRKERYGSEYPEFSNLINNQSRKKFVGGTVIDRPKEEEEEEVEENREIKPIGFGYDNKTKKSKLHNKPRKSTNPFLDIKPKKEPKIVSPEPEEAEDLDNPTPATFERGFEDIVVKSGFGSFDDSKSMPKSKVENESPLKQKEVKKPVEEKIVTKEYVYPPISLFNKIEINKDEKPAWLLKQIEVINETLTNFSIEGEVIGSTKGPTVTRYELALKPGVNVNRVSNISDNLKMTLSATSLRIEAPIPGKPYVGLELPNVEPDIVAYGNVIDNDEFINSQGSPLKLPLGVDIDGDIIFEDITKMPHGLIAGATNSGKSVFIHTLLVSLLMKNSPEDLKLMLIDPKMVELSPYNDLPHLITPVITNPKMAAQGLEWVVDEMEKRYKRFSKNRSRDISSFNKRVKKGQIDDVTMPYIVVIIDELADLMMVAANAVEDSIQRLTQKARAAGIHLLVATQRPTTDVVKGTIKSNIPARIAFRVASHVDSTTILDGAGAEKLLGKGDMLLKSSNRNIRLQGAYISDEEVDKVVDFINERNNSNYLIDHDDLNENSNMRKNEKDELFDDIARFVVSEKKASLNQIQREFNISFNRASDVVDMLEQYSIVSENQGTKARDVLVSQFDIEEVLDKL